MVNPPVLMKDAAKKPETKKPENLVFNWLRPRETNSKKSSRTGPSVPKLDVESRRSARRLGGSSKAYDLTTETIETDPVYQSAAEMIAEQIAQVPPVPPLQRRLPFLPSILECLSSDNSTLYNSNEPSAFATPVHTAREEEDEEERSAFTIDLPDQAPNGQGSEVLGDDEEDAVSICLSDLSFT